MSINQKLSSFLKTNNPEDSDIGLFSNNSLSYDLSATVKEDKPKEKKKLNDKQKEQLKIIMVYNNKILDMLKF